jgi:apolipoprotein N-acyltransferase
MFSLQPADASRQSKSTNQPDLFMIPSLFAALLSAFLLILSSPGMNLGFCAWFALVPLLYAVHINPGRALHLGFLSGLVYYTFLVHWVTISLGNYGHLPWWLTFPALILLAAYMSLYTSLFCWLLSRIKKINPVWTAPFFWVGLDYLRGILFTGFPWQDLGYTQFNIPEFIQVADLAGHHGVTFLLVLANSFFFILFTRRQFLPLAYALVIFIASGSYSFVRIHMLEEHANTLPTIATSIIQPNIEQDQKWRPENRKTAIDAHILLSNQAVADKKIDLVIWPETAIPILGSDKMEFTEILEQTVKSHNYALLSGIPFSSLSNGKRHFYNSAILFTPDGSREVYNKQHLVPFGEYIPLGDKLSFFAPLVESVGNFSAGQTSTPLTGPKADIGILICFESIFPELARIQVENGANLLVNITNDAWFGRSNASIQHLAMAVFRAVENRRSLARSANTGISCFVKPTGHIVQATSLFTPCFISEHLPLVQQKTFFNRIGYLFPLLCLFLCLSFVCLSLLMRKKR